MHHYHSLLRARCRSRHHEERKERKNDKERIVAQDHNASGAEHK